jgi:hypothetical protein
MMLNSSVAFVRNSSKETEEDEVRTKVKVTQPSKLRNSREAQEHKGSARSPLGADGRATALQGRLDINQLMQQQQ